MGKSKKRTREYDDRLDEIMEKMAKISEKVEKLSRSPLADKEKAASPSGSNKENTAPNPDPDSEKIVAEEEEGLEKDECSESQEVDEEWLQILGDDPTECQASKMIVHPDLLKRWQFLCREGIKKEDLESLDKKYSCVEELEAPKLNAQISTAMKEIAIARDKHMLETQKMAVTAMSIVGHLITSVYENKDEGIDLEGHLSHLCDAGKILAAIVHKQSVSRKAFIEPGLSKETRAILKETKIDEFLYGKELGERIKEAKALSKVADDLKLQQPKPNTAAPIRQNLNARTPLARRPPSGQMGSTYTGGRPRPRVFFKNRQQFVNNRAQVPYRQRVPQRQEKKN